MLERYIEHLQELIERLEERRGDDGETEVFTRSAVNIEKDEANLRGRIEFGDDVDNAEVWFEYGTSRTSLSRDTDKRDIDEDDSPFFTINVGDLDDGRRCGRG